MKRRKEINKKDAFLSIYYLTFFSFYQR